MKYQQRNKYELHLSLSNIWNVFQSIWSGLQTHLQWETRVYKSNFTEQSDVYGHYYIVLRQCRNCLIFEMMIGRLVPLNWETRQAVKILQICTLLLLYFKSSMLMCRTNTTQEMSASKYICTALAQMWSPQCGLGCRVRHIWGTKKYKFDFLRKSHNQRQRQEIKLTMTSNKVKHSVAKTKQVKTPSSTCVDE